jgi:hypothetical protein
VHGFAGSLPPESPYRANEEETKKTEKENYGRAKRAS